jgi:ribosomal protein S18 acetylase RimI-like enzyme
MNITIEKAILSDASKLIEVQNASFEEDVIRYSECPAYNESLEKMQEMIKTLLVYKIMANGEIIGDLIIRRCLNKEYYIRVLSVIPEYQNKGVGAETLDYIFKAYPDALKWTLITPKTSIRNCYFYEKLGFQKVGEEVKSEKLTLNVYLKNMNS